MLDILLNVQISWQYGIVALIFIGFDIITGVAQSIFNHNFVSKKMREGLTHKFAVIMLLIVACVIDICGKIVGFDFMGVSSPIFDATSSYIVVMEIGSVFENLSEIYPDIKTILQKGKKEDE